MTKQSKRVLDQITKDYIKLRKVGFAIATVHVHPKMWNMGSKISVGFLYSETMPIFDNSKHAHITVIESDYMEKDEIAYSMAARKIE